MSLNGIAAVARALLYEGYLLYPYRDSSVKNHHRWLFGSLYPRSFAERQHEGDAWRAQTECVIRAGADATIAACVQFLQLATPTAAERRVDVMPRALAELVRVPSTVSFTFDHDGASVRGALYLSVEGLGHGLFKFRVRIENDTAVIIAETGGSSERRDAAVPYAFASLHVLLGIDGGEFVSAIDPPPTLRGAVGRCENVGLWPVLVGDPGAHDTMLAAPIILDDYPRVAPESPGDFFDATEIDEMLTLRVLTLTDAEKRAMRATDPRVHTLLDRTEALAEGERRRLHGAARTPRPGSKVRLAPRPGGDVFDLALAGKTATVLTIEHDYDGRRYVTVTLDDDPGRDLGEDGKPGHRFFFRLDEVELLT